jgi:O-methyltransferase
MLKRLVRRFFHLFGYAVTKVPRPIAPDTLVHSEIRPLARYSPWRADEEFRKSYTLISSNTLVDEYRCYELWRLAKQAGYIEGSFIEIGVWKGGTGCLLAAAAEKSVILCDTFRGVVKAGRYDTYYKGGEHSDASEEEVRCLAAQLGILNRIRILRGVFPEDTGHLVNEKIALCHIDVDVYESARDVFQKIWPLVVQGGLVVFDDYGFEGCEGVTRFVNEIPTADHLFIHNLNGHAILVKT